MALAGRAQCFVVAVEAELREYQRLLVVLETQHVQRTSGGCVTPPPPPPRPITTGRSEESALGATLCACVHVCTHLVQYSKQGVSPGFMSHDGGIPVPVLACTPVRTR
jgi:hypothetical protein